MLKSIAFVCVLAGVGCKADSSGPTASNATDPTSGSGEANGPRSRSGKVDLGMRRPRTDTDADSSRKADRQEARQETRRKRIAELDTDGDGTVSDAERKAGRVKRATELHASLDIDGDGKVTPTELASSKIRRFQVDTVDTNKDGDISVEELTQALESRGKGWGSGRTHDRARRLTVDGAKSSGSDQAKP